jgi:hypothetical protein
VKGEDPLGLLLRAVALLDDLGIPYALGGSLASTFFGEPRSTTDVDLAVVVDVETGERLLARADAEFYVPTESARQAIREHDSFNLLSIEGGMKVDLFVLGDGLLDRRQIERRINIAVPGAGDGLWVTSPEDQVLRKLDWFRQTGSTSDRQWRDVLGILRVCGESLDLDDLRATAVELGLTDLLARALDDALG